MKRKETYKYYIKTKLDRENDLYNTMVKVKGDYYEALMFAIDEVVKALIFDLKLEKEDFMRMFADAYDKMEDEKENE